MGAGGGGRWREWAGKVAGGGSGGGEGAWGVGGRGRGAVRGAAAVLWVNGWGRRSAMLACHAERTLPSL